MNGTHIAGKCAAGAFLNFLDWSLDICVIAFLNKQGLVNSIV